jgi:regulator of RNase E activity RraA
MIALRRGEIACGPAYTIRLRRAAAPAADNARAFLAAYDAAPAGAFVVVQVVDDVGGAVLGDLVVHRLKALGVAGIAVAGPVRDLIGLEEFSPPLWYTQATMIGLELAETATETQVALTVGETRIAPGDAVFADVDGVFCIPQGLMAAIEPAARAVTEKEERGHRALSQGRSLVEALLAPAG